VSRRQARLFLLLLLLAGPFACSKPLTIEQQVIAVIREMETRIEAGERRPFMSHVTEDFEGQNGRLTRDQLRALVIYQLNVHQRLHAQLMPIRVSETGENSASATFKALVTGGPGWIPKNGQVYDFDTHWRLEGGEWMLYQANWTPTPLDEIL